ncbi:anaphase-promoting complex subunit 2-like [Sycon ciliatum]|uniref:anaphase-promoting complex subunit 2-like n=1 Tax=Sycon ciliatum TaxID=27933 RepID=UPI0031F65728
MTANHQQLATALSFVSELCTKVLKTDTENALSSHVISGSVLQRHVNVVHENNADALLSACLSAILSDHIMEELLPHFNQCMVQDDQSQGMAWFVEAVAGVRHHLSVMHALVEGVTVLCPDRGSAIWKQSFELVASLFVDHGSPAFGEKAKQFYSLTLSAYRALHPIAKEELMVTSDDDEEDDDEDDEEDEEEVMAEDEAQQFMGTLDKLTKHLSELAWLPIVIGDCIDEVIASKIDCFVQRYKEKYYHAALAPSIKFCELLVLPWMKLVAPVEALKSDSRQRHAEDVHETWRRRLTEIVSDSLLQLRIKEMFNIVVYYPESIPVIDEMKHCCRTADQKSLLVTSLRRALIDRLLQPGADTRDIIAQYASLVKALRQFDPTGVVMEQVCQPVRIYLRCREDCGRCIVETLLTEESGELADEFERGVKIKGFEDDDYETVFENWDSWKPEPKDACLDNTSASRTKTDVIGLLISIYGSREQFLSQYQALLAARILRSLTYDNMQELGNLERVKLCFEDADLSRCDVMLSDITSSRRVDKAIHEILDEPDNDDDAESDRRSVMPCSGFHTFMLSRAYWESRLPQDTHLAKLKPPQPVQGVMEEYGKQFSRLKNDRRLEWCHNLGQVELDLKFPSSTLSFTCDPMQASLIYLFQGDRVCWSASDLSTELEVSEKTLRSALMYWVSERVLSEDKSSEDDGSTPSLYRIISDTTDLEGGDVADKIVLAGSDDGQVEGDTGDEERIETFWQYVEGMLTNFGELPLERIRGMISLYAEDEVSDSELKKVMDFKLRQQEVHYSAGVYSLPD